MFKKVQFDGWTTKRGVNVTTIPNPAKATDPNAEDLSFALITLMQDREYKVTVRKADGTIEYESDGKTPKKDYPTDALTLKFRNGSSKSLAEYKPEGVSRRIQGEGHLETFQTKETHVMVRGADGKLMKKELFYFAPDPKNPGQNVKVPIEHYVDHVVIVVDEWQFVDAPLAKKDTSAVPVGITVDPNAAISMDAAGEAAPTQDMTAEPPFVPGADVPEPTF